MDPASSCCWEALGTQPPSPLRINCVNALVAGNILKYCQIGVGYWDLDTRGFAEISGNVICGATIAGIIQVQGTELPVPGAPNNGYGPFAAVAGATDMGSDSSPVTDRFSFYRNKIVPATN